MKHISRQLMFFVIFATAALLVFTGVSPYQLRSQLSFLPLVIKNPDPDSGPGATATPSATSITNIVGNYNIPVGPGYTDVSPKQIVRTSTNRLYVAASTCDSYPCTDIAQKLHMYQASSIGIPIGFKHVAANAEPGAIAGWAIAIDGNNRIHVAWTDRTSSCLLYTS